MQRTILIISTLLFSISLFGQTNILVTNPMADKVLKGDFSPNDFQQATVIDNPQEIILGLQNQVNPDSLYRYLEVLVSFENRNTGSDTVSTTRGFGAARRWANSKFQEFSAENENRLIPTYLQFDLSSCGMDQHRNAMAVLPGTDVDNHKVIIIEAHMDSRCETECDIDCLAEGAEDNATGTALVIELARIMSQYSFKNTMVFVLTTGEEQGLLGARALADYCLEEDIPIKGVFNNDVIGGVICGETSSPPSCPFEGHIDSTQVRLFAAGNNRQWTRWIKLQYEEELLPIVTVPMEVKLMSSEDRTGRGGDHIPFRENGFTAMRFTSANEHGNANVSDLDYHDRQHSDADILGIDTDGDGELDSLFVDLNYLARNTVINGMSMTAAGQGVLVPEFTATQTDSVVTVMIDDSENYDHYRVAVRSLISLEHDTLMTFQGGSTFTFTTNERFFFVSVAATNEFGIESCFTNEIRPTAVSSVDPALNAFDNSLFLYQNQPNPFNNGTWITYDIRNSMDYKEGQFFVKDLTGKNIHSRKAQLTVGVHEIYYRNNNLPNGIYIYGIESKGKILVQKRMVVNR